MRRFAEENKGKGKDYAETRGGAEIRREEKKAKERHWWC
jgi:hypothetical protein